MSFSMLDAPLYGAAKSTKIALLTMEDKHITLSEVLYEVIPLIDIMGEMEVVFYFYDPTS